MDFHAMRVSVHFPRIAELHSRKQMAMAIALHNIGSRWFSIERFWLDLLRSLH